MADSTPIPGAIAQAGSATGTDRLIWWFLLLGRLVLGGIFIFAAYSKLRNPWMLFAMSIDSYRMLPTWAVNVLARSLPWIELVVGIFLVTGWLLRWSATLVSLMLIGFMGAMVRAQIHGLSIDCGCFGTSEQLGPWVYIRDGSMLLLALAVTALAFASHRSRRGRA